jgi:hypothetical protein
MATKRIALADAARRPAGHEESAKAASAPENSPAAADGPRTIQLPAATRQAAPVQINIPSGR